MAELKFSELRAVNESRHKRYFLEPDQEWTLTQWALAMIGEAGEACNVIKKMNRYDASMIGNQETLKELRQNLADELADTIVYIDLLALAAGIDLSRSVTKKFNEVSERHGFPERLQP